MIIFEETVVNAFAYRIKVDQLRMVALATKDERKKLLYVAAIVKYNFTLRPW